MNVPISVDNTVKNLPRNFDETSTIQLDLKRRINDSHSYIFETIRPRVVLDALNELLHTELYVQEKITISEAWVRDNEHINLKNFIVDDDVIENSENDDKQLENENENNDEDVVNPGGSETLIFDNNELIGL